MLVLQPSYKEFSGVNLEEDQVGPISHEPEDAAIDWRTHESALPCLERAGSRTTSSDDLCASSMLKTTRVQTVPDHNIIRKIEHNETKGIGKGEHDYILARHSCYIRGTVVPDKLKSKGLGIRTRWLSKEM